MCIRVSEVPLARAPVLGGESQAPQESATGERKQASSVVEASSVAEVLANEAIVSARPASSGQRAENDPENESQPTDLPMKTK